MSTADWLKKSNFVRVNQSKASKSIAQHTRRGREQTEMQSWRVGIIAVFKWEYMYLLANIYCVSYTNVQMVFTVIKQI